MKLSGGKRAGAGRPTLVKKEAGVFLRLSESTIYKMEKFSRLTGATKADLAEMAIDKYLSSSATYKLNEFNRLPEAIKAALPAIDKSLLCGNPDFLYCPKCGEPVLFIPVVPCCGGIGSCECKNCGKPFKYNDETYEIITE